MEIYKEEKFNLPHWHQGEFTINHQFIEYKSTKINIEQIDWVRWGSFASYINGIKMGTSHLFIAGNNRDKIKFSIDDTFYGKSKKNMFDEMLDIIYKIIVTILITLIQVKNCNIVVCKRVTSDSMSLIVVYFAKI